MSRVKRQRRSWVPCLVGPALIFCTAALWANVRYVPQDYATIQQALNASVALDTVRVTRGVYSEALHFPAADVRLYSEFVFSGDSTDLDSTIIDASAYTTNDTGAVITFVRGNTPEAEVAGFVLRGGAGTVYFDGPQHKYGGAIFAYMSSPTIRSNIMTGDSAIGIIYASTAEPAVRHNLFYDNYCMGGQLCGFFDSGVPAFPLAFEWNDIRQNRPDGVGVVVSGPRGVFRYNWFHDFTYNYQNPVMMTSCYLRDMQFCGNVFERINSGDMGVPFIAMDETVSLIDGNVWRDCLLGSHYALVLARGNGRHAQEISHNLFSNLTDPNGYLEGPGTGIFIQSACGVTVHDNTFQNCLGGFQGTIFADGDVDSGIDISITRNRFFGNRSHDNRGAAAVMLYTSVDCSNEHPCTMNNNWFEMNGPVAVTQDYTGHTWNAEGNYWGHPSGPYHPIENPTGQGDTVDVSIHVTPWLTEPPNLVAEEPVRPDAVPDAWMLAPVYPNPFNATLAVRLMASTTTAMSLRVYDINGRLVRDLWRGVVTPGFEKLVMWDGKGEGTAVPSGVYFVTAEAHGGRAVQTQKAVLLR